MRGRWPGVLVLLCGLVVACAEGPPPPEVTAAPREGVQKDPRIGSFQSDGLSINYVEWGPPDGQPLILLHHVNSHARTWDEFARAMSRDFRVIAMDLRGHGDSGWSTSGDYDMEDFAGDVAALVDHLGLERSVVLGGSTGGRVALVFAAQHPERVSALIMEDVGAVRPGSIAGNFARQSSEGDPEFDTLEEWAERLRGQRHRPPDGLYMRLAEHGTKRLPNGKLGLKRDPALLGNLVALEHWHYVESLEAPLLLLLGSESTIVGEDQLSIFRRLKPNVEVVTVEEAGHIVVHDQPEEFEEVVRAFLDRHPL